MEGKHQTMKLASFATPANLTDVNAQQRARWSTYISSTIDEAISNPRSGLTNDSPRAQFFNPTKTDTAADAQQAVISWTAFPNLVKLNSLSDQQRWQAADSDRGVQDEYCEWSVERNANGKITRVTFTCEGPEYWHFLAQADPAKTLQLYQQFVNPKVVQQDLYTAGKYNPRNKWNSSTTTGAMHLIQPNNTLSAEIDIAAAATIVRIINGRELTGELELINCGKYGEPHRNSDPHIGGEVNALARQKADVTLADPVGLYIQGLSTAGWVTPDGTDPATFWSIARGDANHAVRAVYEVAAGHNYVVGDISINGTPIQFGAQITDFITMKLTGVACRFGKSTVQPMTACAAPAAAAQPRLLADILAPAASLRRTG
jgi:hypothetical protein